MSETLAWLSGSRSSGQVATAKAILDGFESLDTETLLADLPDSIRDRLGHQRFRQRLMLRHGRRFASDALLSAVSGGPEKALMDMGSGAVDQLVSLCGAHVYWREIFRIVRRSDLQALNRETGCAVREAATRGRLNDFGVEPLATFSGNGLGEAIRDEGALCWAFWLSGMERDAARRLRALTPLEIVKRIPADLEESAEKRRRRREVLEAELEALIGNSAGEGEP